jgi:hypothetical protein
MNARLKQYQKVKSTKSILIYAPIAVHALRFARLRQFIPQNNTALQLKRRKTGWFSSFFILLLSHFPHIPYQVTCLIAKKKPGNAIHQSVSTIR